MFLGILWIASYRNAIQSSLSINRIYCQIFPRSRRRLDPLVIKCAIWIHFAWNPLASKMSLNLESHFPCLTAAIENTALFFCPCKSSQESVWPHLALADAWLRLLSHDNAVFWKVISPCGRDCQTQTELLQRLSQIWVTTVSQMTFDTPCCQSVNVRREKQLFFFGNKFFFFFFLSGKRLRGLIWRKR